MFSLSLHLGFFFQAFSSAALWSAFSATRALSKVSVLGCNLDGTKLKRIIYSLIYTRQGLVFYVIFVNRLVFGHALQNLSTHCNGSSHILDLEKWLLTILHKTSAKVLVNTSFIIIVVIFKKKKKISKKTNKKVRMLNYI